MPVQMDNKARADVLLKLYGDVRSEPYCQSSAAHRRGLPNVRVWFTSKTGGEGRRFQDQVEDVSMEKSAHQYHVGIFIR